MGRGWGAALLAVLAACAPTAPTDDGGGTGGGGAGGNTPPPGCEAATCDALGLDCGTASDGCGGTLNCGGCSGDQTCGGGGVPNVCGGCVARTCAEAGAECGAVPDGCGDTLSCGGCPSGQTCGGGGTPNACGVGPCVPATCEKLGKDCGVVSDGCGGTVECGGCPAGETCGGSGIDNVCGAPADVSCADVDLGAALPLSRVFGNSGSARVRNRPTCKEVVDGERLLAWTAPQAGTYVFDTTRSTVDTALELRAGCAGEVLACADGGISYGRAAKVTARLRKGQRILISLYAPFDRAPTLGAHLHISRRHDTEAGACVNDADDDADGRVDCADADCAGEPACAFAACVSQTLSSSLPVRVSTREFKTLRANEFVSACSIDDLNDDVAFRFVAPHPGEFAFHAVSSEQDGQEGGVSLILKDSCLGTERACAGPQFRLGTRLSLDQGEDVVVILDGYGLPTLFIDEVRTEEGALCSDDFDNDLDGLFDANDPGCG